MPAPMTTLVEHGFPVGVRRAELPLPFPVGPVNCWVLLGDPVTVVDPGMLFENSLDVLERTLADAGLTLKSIEQIVVTHAHPDHFGAAGELARRADAPIVCGEPERRRLIDFHPDRVDARHAQMAALLRSVGVPEALEDTLTKMREVVKDLVAPIDAGMVKPLRDGATLRAGGRSYTAHVTPGHASGHLALAHGRTLLSGDHLLANITPNPFIEADPHSPTGRRKSLLEYLASFDRFGELDPEIVLPGHGPAFTDLPLLVQNLRLHHDNRAGLILDLITLAPNLTIYELAERFFNGLSSYHVVLGVSEIAAHIDLLESRGQVLATGQPQRFVAM